MTYYGKIKHYLLIGWRHRIAGAVIIFIVWMFTFDQNSIPSQISRSRNIRALNQEKQFYIDKIHDDSVMLNELKTNDNNLEKYAREQYFMKADNEDVFEVVER